MKYQGIKFTLLLLALIAKSVAEGTPEDKIPRPERAVYQITGESEITYAVGVKILLAFDRTVSGKTSDVTGTIRLNEEALAEPAAQQNTVSGELFVDVAGFRSGIGKRDANVRELLESDKYPRIKFTLFNIEPNSNLNPESLSGVYFVTGNLEIRGRTKEVSFPVVISPKGKKLAIDGSFFMRLTDFGVTPPTVLIFVGQASDEVALSVHLIAESKKPGMFSTES